MITLRFKGRLANQLMQILAAQGIAEANGTTAAIPAWKYAPMFTPIQQSEPAETHYPEPNFHYEPVIGDDLDLDGYWQSERYYPKQGGIRFTEEYKSKIRQHAAYDRPNIGIHIRRGDYVGHKEYYQLPVHWYAKALTSIPDWDTYNVVIVSDDYEYCKLHLSCLPHVYFMEGSDVGDLCAFSLCDWQICSNSTFSWIGAYFGDRQQVIHPGVLFRGNYGATKDIKDFWPERWTCMPDTRIDLKDMTFTIPLNFDSKDRKQNLSLSVCMLQNAFDTNISVCEQGGDALAFMDVFTTYTQLIAPVFHRTRMLNQMAEAAITPYIANWDCDIFIPPMQVLLAVLHLRNGADAVYPYDGRFARMNREMFKPLERSLDLCVAINYPFRSKAGNAMPETSVGGALFWNRDAFIEAGGENEHFVSFGPEDVERYERINRLGLDLRRVKGCLYHMNHYIGPDSSKFHGNFKRNQQELARMRAMTDEQLMEYIKTWRNFKSNEAEV